MFVFSLASAFRRDAPPPFIATLLASLQIVTTMETTCQTLFHMNNIKKWLTV